VESFYFTAKFVETMVGKKLSPAASFFNILKAYFLFLSISPMYFIKAIYPFYTLYYLKCWIILSNSSSFMSSPFLNLSINNFLSLFALFYMGS
jgi:hypothetical protein